MYRIIAHRYPNNEIRVTHSAMPALRPIKGDDDNDGIENQLSPLRSDSPQKNPTLSLVPNSKTSPLTVGYGLLPSKSTVFGLNAKRKLIRSGAALENSISSPEECLFLTATLPASTSQAFQAIAEWSGYIVNSLKAWISNHVRSKLDFYCWEYQKRGALHLHYCVHVQDESARNHIQNGFKDWWIELLHRVGDRSSVDLFRKNKHYSHLSDTSKVRAVAEICRKSPARYLAKYLSKSAKNMKGRGLFFAPSRWWGTSRPLKNLLESLTDTLELIQGGYFAVTRKMSQINHAIESTEGKVYSFPHKYGMGSTAIAYPQDDSDFQGLWDSLIEMSSLSRFDKPRDQQSLSVILKPHKSKLLAWSYRLLHESDSRHEGRINSFTFFHNTLMNISPSTSENPLHSLYEMRNILYEIKVYAQAVCLLYDRGDRDMIDFAMADIEFAIDQTCQHGYY